MYDVSAAMAIKEKADGSIVMSGCKRQRNIREKGARPLAFWPAVGRVIAL